jgi:hypothetical protein
MSKGKKIVQDHCYFGTNGWVGLINNRPGAKPLDADDTIVANSTRLANGIDAAIGYARRQALKECLEIAHKNGAYQTEESIRVLLKKAEWPDRETQINADPASCEAQPVNPFTVKPPI